MEYGSVSDRWRGRPGWLVFKLSKDKVAWLPSVNLEWLGKPSGSCCYKHLPQLFLYLTVCYVPDPGLAHVHPSLLAVKH